MIAAQHRVNSLATIEVMCINTDHIGLNDMIILLSEEKKSLLDWKLTTYKGSKRREISITLFVLYDVEFIQELEEKFSWNILMKISDNGGWVLKL